MHDAEALIGQIGLGQRAADGIAPRRGVVADPVAPGGQEMRRQLLDIDHMVEGGHVDQLVAAFL